MALSSQSVVSDGVLTAIDITIDYRVREDIRVLFDGTPVTLAEGKWSWVGTTDKRINITPAQANGVIIKIQRVTGVTAMIHDFSDGAQFIADNLDENFNQLLEAVQELEEGSGGGGTIPGNPTAAQVSFAPTTSILSTNVQAALVEVEGYIPASAINFPLSPGIAQIGTSLRYAREDHVHPSDGGGGGGGTPGTSTGLVYAYKKAVSPPSDNPGDVTFNFVVGKITFPNTDALANGWTKTIPAAGTDPLYVTVASASGTGSTDNIAAAEWATPVVLVQNGSNGTPGLNAATVYIYQRSTVNSAPALPSATVTYQFTPPNVSGLNNGWTTTVPSASAGEFLFVSTATAVGTTSTDTIGPSEWAAAQLMARNGLQGSPGPTGSNGVAGQRGTLIISTSGSSWSDSVATAAIVAVGVGGPYDRDQVTITNGTSFTQARFYSSGSWIVTTAYIDGNLLVTGTVSAAKINGGILTGIQMQIGTGNTPAGKALEITAGGILYADNVRGGSLTGNNFNNTANPGISGTCYSTSTAAVQGLIDAANSSSLAGGCYGKSNYSGTAGIVGSNQGYDFYATGTGTNFGPFTGAHDALVGLNEDPELGDILVDVYRLCKGAGVSNTIFSNERSSRPNQPAVIGVVATRLHALTPDGAPAAFTVGRGDNWEPIIDPSYAGVVETHLRTAVNALGEGVINVVGEGGDIAAGDLIVTSSVLGKGMRQADDIVRSYTVAKAREAVSFTSNEVKQVACIYLCG